MHVPSQPSWIGAYRPPQPPGADTLEQPSLVFHTWPSNVDVIDTPPAGPSQGSSSAQSKGLTHTHDTHVRS